MDSERLMVAAEGYLQLQMAEDALLELEKLEGREAHSLRSLELQLAAVMMQGDWSVGAKIAMQLCRMSPQQTSYFLHAGYCLHECGDTLLARSVLESGPISLQNEALYHYNMGCYCAVLGELEPARDFVLKSFEMDPALRQQAEHDADLKGLNLG